MRLLVQTIDSAEVLVGNDLVGEVGPGLCVYVGVGVNDTPATAEQAALKISQLRILASDARPFDLPITEGSGEVLVVSCFSLLGSTNSGRRPSWSAAAPSEKAEEIVDAFAGALRSQGCAVATGHFGAEMVVRSDNHGPLNLMIEVET